MRRSELLDYDEAFEQHSPLQRIAGAIDGGLHELRAIWRRRSLRRAVDAEPGGYLIPSDFVAAIIGGDLMEFDGAMTPARLAAIKAFRGYVMTGEFGGVAEPDPVATSIAAPLCRADQVLLDGNAGGVAGELLAERRRQVEAEGWSTKHDERHTAAELAAAGAAYAWVVSNRHRGGGDRYILPMIAAADLWPFSDGFKPKDDRRDLVRAGALIIAAIERLDREAILAADVEGA